jgi:haloalkane dehalogenase
VLPREITRATGLLDEIEAGIGRLNRLPTLIVWADKDFAFKEQARQRWEATFPNHRSHVVAGAGHFLQDDGGADICRAISDWWVSTT